MSNISSRRFKLGDEKDIVNIIHRASLEINIKDYKKEDMIKLCNRVDEDFIINRSNQFHTYVFLDNDKIIAVGSIGPYWDSLTESSLFNIFVLPEYIGKGVGKKIITTLEQDEYYKRANRIEIPSSITALEFYRHLGYDFKKYGNITDEKGHYILEKYPKLGNHINRNQYNMRIYIDNEYHNYKEFIYQLKKDAYKKYVEECWGSWNELDQKKCYENFISKVAHDTYIIQLNGVDIGFYNGMELEDGSYEIGNICIKKEYQGRGIGTTLLKDIIELHKNQDIHIQYFKQNPVGKLYEKLGFVYDGDTEFHYQLIKYSNEKVKK